MKVTQTMIFNSLQPIYIRTSLITYPNNMGTVLPLVAKLWIFYLEKKVVKQSVTEYIF